MHWHRVVVGGCPHLNMFVAVSRHSKTLLVTLLDSVALPTAFHLFKQNLISSSAKRVLLQPTFPSFFLGHVGVGVKSVSRKLKLLTLCQPKVFKTSISVFPKMVK